MSFKTKSMKERIAGNPYVGRGIVVGKSADGRKAVFAYFIMGRSENSRNRVFVEKGDEVVIESTYGGKTQGVLHISEMLHPLTLGISGKWGAKGSGLIDFAHEGPHYNTLLNDDERDIGFMMGNINNSVAVKVYKA